MPAWGALYNSLLMGDLQVKQAAQNLQAGDLDLQQKRQQMELQNRYRDQLLKSLELDPTRPNPQTASIETTSEAAIAPEHKVLRDLRKERDEAAQNVKLNQPYCLEL